MLMQSCRWPIFFFLFNAVSNIARVEAGLARAFQSHFHRAAPVLVAVSRGVDEFRDSTAHCLIGCLFCCSGGATVPTNPTIVVV